MVPVIASTLRADSVLLVVILTHYYILRSESTVGEEPLFLIVVIHNSHILYALEIILTHRTFIHFLVTLLRSTHEYEQCCLPHRTLQYSMCIVASLLLMKQTSRLSMSYFDDVHGSSVDRNLSCFRNAIIMLVRYQHVNYLQQGKVCVHTCLWQGIAVWIGCIYCAFCG